MFTSPREISDILASKTGSLVDAAPRACAYQASLRRTNLSGHCPIHGLVVEPIDQQREQRIVDLPVIVDRYSLGSGRHERIQLHAWESRHAYVAKDCKFEHGRTV